MQLHAEQKAQEENREQVNTKLTVIKSSLVQQVSLVFS